MKGGGKLLLLMGLIGCALATTSLSTNNCPSDFTITAANASIAPESGLIRGIYGGVYSDSDKREMEEAFNSGTSSTVSSKLSTLSILIPFALIAVGFLIMFVIALCCCVFEKSCPPCESWKRDFTIRPY